MNAVTIIEEIGGEFAVHLAGCNDIAHIIRGGRLSTIDIDIDSKVDVVEYIHGDILAENDETAEDYIDSDTYRFARCCNHIPTNPTEEVN